MCTPAMVADRSGKTWCWRNRGEGTGTIPLQGAVGPRRPEMGLVRLGGRGRWWKWKCQGWSVSR